MSCGSGVLLCWLTPKSAVGDLGGVEKPGAVRAADGADEHAMGGAGDKVADVAGAGKRGHGFAVGLFGFDGGNRLTLASRGLLESERPSFTTAGNGEVFSGGVEVTRGSGNKFDGFGHADFSLGDQRMAGHFQFCRERA